MTIKYRFFSSEDAPALSRFSKTFLDPRHPSLRRSQEPEYYLWRNDLNPFGRGSIALAEENGRLVGCFALTPKRIRLHGESLLGAEIDDAFVSREFQGQGIFRTLADMILEEARQKGIRLLYGTPNPISYPVFRHKLGFSELPHCRVQMVLGYCCPFPWKSRRYRREGVDTEKNAPTLLSSLMAEEKSVQAQDILEIVHDEEYLRWRFIANPDSYHFSADHLVLKEGFWGHRKIGYLADQIQGRGNRNEILNALQSARRYFHRRGISLMAAWVQTAILDSISLAGHGFIAVRKKPVVLRLLDPSTDFARITRVPFHMADSDNI